MSLQSGHNFGPYEIEKLLGRGGMGEVYLARDPRLNRKVAIKVVSSELLPTEQLIERFRREAGVAAVLNHPNICTIYETGEAEGRLYICMEYIEGKTLRERLAESAMPLPEVLDISIQIADALDEARRKNVIHRDIKSSNILLTSRGQVKILDFGLAKQMRDVSAEWSQELTEERLTRTGDVRGTVAYMSPEQALGKNVDHRSDIFSFGVVLYEMLAGRLPFSGNSSTEIVDAILHRDPLPVARFNNEVPDELIRILNKMLDKDPEMRYQSVHEVWADLRRIQPDTTRTRHLRFWQKPGFPFWPAAILAIILVGLLGLSWIMIPSKEGKPQEPTAKHSESSKRIEIAVLPFRYIGDDPNRAYLGTMVTDAMIAGLQVAPKMAVAPYEDVRGLKENTSIPEIAKHLGVEMIVRGTVAAIGEETQIVAELLSGSGEVVATQSLTGRPVITMNLIKDRVLTAMQVDESALKQIDQVRTPSEEAYKFYLEAWQYQEGWDVENNLARAASLYREAIAIDPDFAAAHARLAIVLLDQFHQTQTPSLLAEALTRSRAAVALDPDLPEGLIAYGRVLMQSGKSIEAQDAFERALQLALGNDAACRSLASMYSALGRHKEARNMLQKAVTLRPTYWMNHYELGTFEWQFRGNLDTARKHLEKANQLHPEGFAPVVMLGNIYLTEGYLEQAEDYFRKALAISANPYAYNNLGLVHYYRKQYDLALRNWQAVLKELPDKPMYQANVADAFRQLGQKDKASIHYQEAIRGFRKALKLNGSDDRARATLAMVLSAVGQCEEAIREIRTVLTHHPKSAELSAYAAITLSRCNDMKGAKEVVLASIEMDNLLMIRFDPDLDRLRKAPEVEKALNNALASSSDRRPL